MNCLLSPFYSSNLFLFQCKDFQHCQLFGLSFSIRLQRALRRFESRTELTSYFSIVTMRWISNYATEVRVLALNIVLPQCEGISIRFVNPKLLKLSYHLHIKCLAYFWVL